MGLDAFSMIAPAAGHTTTGKMEHGPVEDQVANSASLMAPMTNLPGYQQFLREQDRFLPLLNVAKVMGGELRHLPYAKISKDATAITAHFGEAVMCCASPADSS